MNQKILLCIPLYVAATVDFREHRHGFPHSLISIAVEDPLAPIAVSRYLLFVLALWLAYASQKEMRSAGKNPSLRFIFCSSLVFLVLYWLFCLSVLFFFLVPFTLMFGLAVFHLLFYLLSLF